ncbi:phospholipid/glycerol acyltransferase [Enterobacter cloacae]|uniref:L-ornithine N(alpha)-acyltransferase n=1 Tax=Enterobacter cloacae TaxID=550 RepID=A0A377M5E8_ENTCL|nr:phospholipid/glycerol acyltransferase [Enterobacter cloacae]
MAEQCRQHVIRLGKGVPGVFKTQCAIARPEDRATLKRELAQAECLGKPAMAKLFICGNATDRKRLPCCASWDACARSRFAPWRKGSGKRRDTDSYDDDYLHLILWDEDDLEIVGAYRFMPTARQVEQRGLEGLYSYSLFHYDDKMQDVLEHGIELGRSFIQPRYWGRRGLDYLWSGIGAYLARYPHYRYLFGPVSISGGLPPAHGICWWRFTASGSRRHIP